MYVSLNEAAKRARRPLHCRSMVARANLLISTVTSIDAYSVVCTNYNNCTVFDAGTKSAWCPLAEYALPGSSNETTFVQSLIL